MTPTLSPTDRTLSRLSAWTERVLRNLVSDLEAGRTRKCRQCGGELRFVGDLVFHEHREMGARTARHEGESA